MQLATPAFLKRDNKGQAKDKKVMDKATDEADEETGESGSKTPRKEDDAYMSPAESPAPKAKEVNRRLPASLAGSSSAGGGKGQRGGRGRKGRGQRSLQVDDLDPMDRLVIQSAELNLENKAETRESKGYLERTLLAPLEHPLVQGGLEEAKLVNQDRQAPGNRGKNLGSGHVRIFGKSMQGLAECPKVAADPDLKNALEKFWAEIFTVKSEDILKEEIQVFRVIRPKISSRVTVSDQALGDYARVVIRMKPSTRLSSTSEDLQEALVNFARSQHWAVMVGTPPRTKRERVLADTLAEIRSDLQVGY